MFKARNAARFIEISSPHLNDVIWWTKATWNTQKLGIKLSHFVISIVSLGARAYSADINKWWELTPKISGNLIDHNIQSGVMPTCHQQPWFWQCRRNESLSCMTKDFLAWAFICLYIFYVSSYSVNDNSIISVDKGTRHRSLISIQYGNVSHYNPSFHHCDECWHVAMLLHIYTL